MITFTGDDKRVENYHKQKEILNELIMFKAADGVNNYQSCKEECNTNDWCSDEFLDSIENNKRSTLYKQYGKIGCHLSFLRFFKFVVDNNIDSCLVFEDDITLHPGFVDHIDMLLDQSSDLDTHFIRLFNDPRKKIHEKQFVDHNKITDTLYRMIPQWGFLGQVITKRCAEYFLAKAPYNQPLDVEFNELFCQELNAVTVKNNLLNNAGAVDKTDKKSRLGSIIWNINCN